MNDNLTRQRLIVAIGGNAIHPGHIEGTASEQLAIAERTARALLPLLKADNALVLTHGNGPVVGKIMMRQALAEDNVAPMTLDICVAHSQGGIAYLLMQAFENVLRLEGDSRHVVCMLTQVEVSEADPAFTRPTKPIGFFYTEAQAQRVAARHGWEMREDAGRGWRQVVPSPAPQRVLDCRQIESIMDSGAVVIAGGGGGIPVVRQADGTSKGIEAVIDKDLTTGVMATRLGIPLFVMLTAVDNVCINFGQTDERALGIISADELTALQAAGHFPDGSMGPKIQAALDFLERGGERAVIAHLDHCKDAVEGRCGTQIVRDTEAFTHWLDRRAG